ncbi:hypothetical protein NWI01_25180 [Nitrobacter winogradskyi]|uniref:Lantibiotic biosynthesis protein dehydration domain-containing protein n=1 Tax=Nitrobacter winogradskyi TaxID=913 RepID=A0A4Y3WH72_NITWI|nr:hypothetical protein NWI01_25180 [Nitrobacter winogradskyi]
MHWRSEDFELACLTLDEIFSSAYLPVPPEKRDFALVNQRLCTWRDMAANGDDVLLRKRLARDGLDPSDVIARLGGVVRSETHRAPAWVSHCESVCALLLEPGGDVDPACVNLPFAPLFWHVVASAMKRLTETSDRSAVVLGTRVRSNLASALAERLAKLCELPFYEAMMRWRNAGVDTAGADPSFAAFIAHMRETGFDLLFARYPVLLRLITEIQTQWLETSLEFVARLAADAALLREQPWGPGTCEVAAIEVGLSDFHNSGRSVLVVTFADEVKVVYKPKSLATDHVAAEVATLFNDARPDFAFRVPEFLDQGDYGWCRYVAVEPCRDLADIDLYFWRAGAWLGVFHLLSSSDMHMENIIASGTTPVPVDFETILQGLSWHPQELPASLRALWMVSDFLERSVIAVGMLPAYVRDENDGLISMGGIEPSRTSIARVAWRDVNSAGMQPYQEIVEREVATNLPLWKGCPQDIMHHRSAFLRGVRESWETALDRRPELIALVERVSADLEVRRVFRPTRFYYMLVKRLSDHRQMNDGACWSMQTEFIARLFDWDDAAEEPWKIFRHERAALLRLNIPAFHVDADKAVIRGPDGDITNLDMDSGLIVARARINDLEQDEMALQSCIAATSLQVPSTVNRLVPLESPAAQLDIAKLVSQHLEQRAFRADGAAAWLGLDLVDHQKFAQLAPLGFDLYGGTGGIAVFFAALARVRRDDAARRMVHAAMAAAHHQIASHNAGRLTRSMSVGGGVGVGSMVYADATVASILRDPSFADCGVEAARLLDAKAISADDRFDVIAGAAGACLGLLRLYHLLGAPALLAQAQLWANHLEAHRNAFPPHGVWSSKAFANHPLTGLSHGAAGYALVFSRLYAATGEARYRDLARDCVAFENGFFDDERRTWPDLRRNPETGAYGWPNQWCYGAIGIGYSRLSMLEDGAVDRAALIVDVERAVEAAITGRAQVNDTLCCGEAGVIDFLVEAGRRLHRPEVVTLARTRMLDMTTRLAGEGDFAWDIGTADYNLGLHRGVAGIGLVALRLEDPDIPAVAIWE